MPIVVFDSKLAEQRKVLLSKTPAFVMFLLPIDVGYEVLAIGPPGGSEHRAPLGRALAFLLLQL
jgi:hypothetical protein